MEDRVVVVYSQNTSRSHCQPAGAIVTRIISTQNEIGGGAAQAYGRTTGQARSNISRNLDGCICRGSTDIEVIDDRDINQRLLFRSRARGFGWLVTLRPIRRRGCWCCRR